LKGNRMTRNDIINVECTLHADPAGALAILVSSDGLEDSAVWLPRSQIEYDRNASVGDIITVTMPEWLATDKGLS
jgi:hypothetical protein